METNKEQDFFEEEIDDIGEEGIVEYDITTSPRDLTPANIVDMIDSGIIEIPLFQRNYVWDIKKASKLVESLILGLPVPELFFYTDRFRSSSVVPQFVYSAFFIFTHPCVDLLVRHAVSFYS